MDTAEKRTSVVREHYTKMMEELLYDADTLGNSRPLSEMTASIMREQKETALARIADIIGFLEVLRREIEKIKTDKIS